MEAFVSFLCCPQSHIKWPLPTVVHIFLLFFIINMFLRYVVDIACHFVGFGCCSCSPEAQKIPAKFWTFWSACPKAYSNNTVWIYTLAMFDLLCHLGFLLLFLHYSRARDHLRLEMWWVKILGTVCYRGSESKSLCVANLHCWMTLDFLWVFFLLYCI